MEYGMDAAGYPFSSLSCEWNPSRLFSLLRDMKAVFMAFVKWSSFVTLVPLNNSTLHKE